MFAGGVALGSASGPSRGLDLATGIAAALPLVAPVGRAEAACAAALHPHRSPARTGLRATGQGVLAATPPLIAIAWPGAAIDQHPSRAGPPTEEPLFSTGFPHASRSRRKLSTASAGSLPEKRSPLDRRRLVTRAGAAAALHEHQKHCSAVIPLVRRLRQALGDIF